ncbi:ABC transporter ATP-binding protein [Roseisolibacter sp. H3M3-2]|uniref:ABC transporter ATP-binding protein n=1 Tax=Roseisolibacter sp. H3M3-2 TaxID=3031323 RepID=UPI0023D9A4E7|nr:ABC transporter ATP-binding protein [Roseisolibacter sp. H3M3-2]MDF1504412.1 ABC transporter ATP-binding protein [Roseisolibacter sp. H3M3-2]
MPPPTTGAPPRLPQPRTLRERLGALRNLPPFLRLVWQTSPGLTVWTLALRLARALLPVATLYVGKLIVDEVVARVGAPGAPATLAGWYESGRLDRLLLLLGAEFGLAVLSDVLGRLVSLADSLLSERFSSTTSVRLMEHAATLDLEDFEDSELQDRLDRARRQASGRMTLISQLFGQAQDVVTIASFAAGLAVYAPWLIALLLVALVPAFLGEAHFNARSYALAYARTPEQRELDYVRQTGASVETAKEVKIFGLNAFLIARYRELAEGFYRANRTLAVRRAGWGGVLTAAGTAGYYVAYAWLAWRTVAGTLTIGDLTFLSASFRRLRTLLEGLLTGFSQTAGQALYLDDLFSFFEIEPEIRSPANPRPFPRPMREGLVFEDVGFIYPGAERWAVRHLSFTLRAGEVLALVGENGAGKTTLVKLLARLYDPDEGRILLDGHDLREYDLDALRANVGVIFQDFVRYHLTAADNIAVGRIAARGDRARIEDAARRALADEVVARLPEGYDQVVGKRFRRGVDLSGGEWQKIAIARAYMRDAQLLILDEPTAALDARAEFEVFERFKELGAGRTAVLISHRFSSVRMADRILVLADGRVEAAGTHAELMAQGGRYAELFELQAAGYR